MTEMGLSRKASDCQPYHFGHWKNQTLLGVFTAPGDSFIHSCLSHSRRFGFEDTVRLQSCGHA